MANKYGKNGEAVAAFLDEVSATDLSAWRAFLELESSSDGFGAAIDAVAAAPWSASARTAISSACAKIIRGLGLGNIVPRMGVSIIASRVKVAAMGLAEGDALAPERLRVILAPFISLGFRSVADPATAPSEQGAARRLSSGAPG